MTGTALRCYTCNYENDKKCKGEEADLGAIAYAVDPDKDEFKYCAKISYSKLVVFNYVICICIARSCGKVQ